MKKIFLFLISLVSIVGLAQTPDATINTHINSVRTQGFDPVRTATPLQDLEDSKIGTLALQATGTNTYVVGTFNAHLSAYLSGQTFPVYFQNGNTTPATLKLGTLAAINIVKNTSTALASGDIPSGGRLLWCYYDGTNFRVSLPTTTGALLASNNLSDVSNAATARGNLGAQDALVSGTNIKTVNGTSVLGSGDIAIAGGSSLTPTAVKTSNYSAAANDLIPVNAASGNIVITLPTAPADKTQVAVKMIAVTAGTYTTTINTGGSDVFNKTGGGTSLSLILLNQAVILQYNTSGSIWYVLSDDLSLSQLDTRFISGFVVSSSAPTTLSSIWIDTGNAYAGMYPVRRYINGAWEPVNPNMDYYDPIGQITSRGRPLLVGVWGQSQVATAFNRDYMGSKDVAFFSTSSTSINTTTATNGTSLTITIGTGLSWYAGKFCNLVSRGTPAEFINGKVTAYNSGTGSFTFTVITQPPAVSSYTDWDVSVLFPGDIEKDNRITLWNSDAAAWTVPDFYNQPTGANTGFWSWNLSIYGENNVQAFAKSFIKRTGRAVRIVQWRNGGTPLAYWEKGASSGGAPGWTNFNAQMLASGIPPADLVIGIHGEGGLSDATYISAQSSYYNSLYKSVIPAIRTATWGKAETAIIMPSHGNGFEKWPLSLESTDPAEYAIRTLSEGEDPYTAHALGPHQKAIRVPTAGEGGNTSTTSLNLGTLVVGANFTITVSGTFGYSVNNAIWLVSRAGGTGANRIKAAFVSGTGTLTLNLIAKYGSGTLADWDVLPQDYLHNTVQDNISFGNAIDLAYANIGLRKGPEVVETVDANGDQTSTYEYNAGTVNFNFPERSTNTGITNWIFGPGNLKMTSKFAGTSSNMDLIFYNKSAGVAGTADEVFRITFPGTLHTKPMYWRYTGAAALDTRIEMENSGNFGMNFIAGTTGSSGANLNFKFGANNFITMTENAGNRPRFNQSYSTGSATYNTNTTAKLSRVVETGGSLYGAITANGTQTSTIFVNTPITDISAFSVIEVELTVVGTTSDVSKSFSAKKSAMFTVANFGTVTMVSEDATTVVRESTAGIMASPTTGITFSVVSGQISATLTRGATVGTFNFASVAVATIRTF